MTVTGLMCYHSADLSCRLSAISMTVTVHVDCDRADWWFSASFVARTFRPKQLTGLDLTNGVIELCNKLHRVPNLNFVQGNAQALPFSDAEFNVVYNCESAHCYPNVLDFYDEAYRVLKPGGWFCMTDIRLASRVAQTCSELTDTGFLLQSVHGINHEVVRALEITAHEKEAFLLPLMSPTMASAFREFTGMPNSHIFRELMSGRTQYTNYLCQKPLKISPMLVRKRPWYTTYSNSFAAHTHVTSISRLLWHHQQIENNSVPSPVHPDRADVAQHNVSSIESQNIQTQKIEDTMAQQVDNEQQLGHFVSLVKRKVATLLVHDVPVANDQPLMTMGLTSKDMMLLHRLLDGIVDTQLAITSLFEHRTIRGIAGYLSVLDGRSDARCNSPVMTPKEAATRNTLSCPSVIIGMGCVGPGTNKSSALHRPSGLWLLLACGADQLQAAPQSRCDHGSKALPGHFISGAQCFDNIAFSMSGSECKATDPNQRVLLQTAFSTLADACYSKQTAAASHIGVFVGFGLTSWQEIIRDTPHNAWSMHGLMPSAAAGRVAFVLDLKGPCMSIDTACSSSLVAVQAACQSLQHTDTECALAAGVNLHPHKSSWINTGPPLAPDGRCKTFDVSQQQPRTS